LALCFHVNIFARQPWRNFLDLYIEAAALLFIEPLLLTLFGTTPGKRIFGISVLSATGKRLTYQEAFLRTFEVYRFGEGFYLPIYSLIRNYISYNNKGQKNEPRQWDISAGSVLLIKRRQTSWYQPLAYLLVLAALAAALVLAAFVPRVPPNTGRLTVAQFAENYNYLARYYKAKAMLDSSGEWYITETVSDDWGELILGDGTADGFPLRLGTPELRFETDENGYITSVEFTYTSALDDTVIYFEYIDPLYPAALAVACAQKEYSALSSSADRIYDALRGYLDFSECGTQFAFSISGSTITITITP
jgi:uncharacterized RDD family membrane protein YckC